MEKNKYISPAMAYFSINPARRFLNVSEDLIVEAYNELEGGTLDD